MVSLVDYQATETFLKFKTMIKATKYETIAFVMITILIVWGIVLFHRINQPKNTKTEKVYPVKVELYGDEYNSYFDCDSANLNYAWKDGVKIQLKGVYQIKFN
jgi:hypothetical protein